MTSREWCKENRQWKREHNIAYAQLMLAQSGEQEFWQSVLDELGVCDGRSD